MEKMLLLCRRSVEEYRESTVMEMARCPGEGWEVNPGHRRVEGLIPAVFTSAFRDCLRNLHSVMAVTAGPSWNYFQVSSPFSCHSMLFFVTLAWEKQGEMPKVGRSQGAAWPWAMKLCFPCLGWRSARVGGRQQPPRWPLLLSWCSNLRLFFVSRHTVTCPQNGWQSWFLNLSN